MSELFTRLCEQGTFVVYNPWNTTCEMNTGAKHENISYDFHCLLNMCSRMDRFLKFKNGSTVYDIFVMPYLNNTSDNFDETTQRVHLDEYQLYGVFHIDKHYSGGHTRIERMLNNDIATYVKKLPIEYGNEIPLIICKLGFTEEYCDEKPTVMKIHPGIVSEQELFIEKILGPTLTEGAALLMREKKEQINAITKTQKR